MKPIATDTASFPNLVTDGYVCLLLDYAESWLASGLPVRLVGVNYDPATRAIAPPLVEEVHDAGVNAV